MKVNVVLNLGSTSNAKVLVDAAHYTTNMSGNPLFASAEIATQIAAVSTATANLQEAMKAPLSGTKTDTVNAARETLDRLLAMLASLVENLANSPSLQEDERIGVVHSAGMDVKSQATPKKRVFAVALGETEGSVHLTAAGGANAHEWQYTSNLVNFSGRIPLSTTTTSNTSVSGLKSGTKYAFFHKAIVAGTVTDWEGPVFITVL